MTVLNRLLAGALPLVPRPVLGRVARRYIAGPSLDDAIRVVRELNNAGVMATVDLLGEHLTRIQDAEQAFHGYIEALERIADENLDSNISVKLTALGLKVDPSACLAYMRRLCAAARERRNFVRIDMEDSSCTTATLAMYRELRREFGAIGAVIQAYLRRSRADVLALAAENANLRVCKGIYIEPREIAYRGRDIVQQNFVDLVAILLRSHCYIGIATHDETVVWHALRLIDELGLKPKDYEFQMLLGVDEELRRILVGAGHRLRVYVPFGAHWHAYSLRRLKENPDIVGHVVRDTFRRTVGNHG